MSAITSGETDTVIRSENPLNLTSKNPRGRIERKKKVILEQLIKRKKDQDSHDISSPTESSPNVYGSSGMAAFLTPSQATYPGSSIFTHVGTSAQGQRIVVPIPSLLSTPSSLSSGVVPLEAVANASIITNQKQPSILTDIEWFNISSYPEDIREFLLTSYNMNYHPQDIVGGTDQLIRSAYKNLHKLGFMIKYSVSLKTIFDNLTSFNPTTKKPAFPYNQSVEVSNLYIVLLFVMTTLLNNLGNVTRPIRSYPELTYPGIIISAILVRMVGYYRDLSAVLGLNTTTPPLPFLRYGRVTRKSPALQLVENKPESSKPKGILELPGIAVMLKTAAEYATNRVNKTSGFTRLEYESLQMAALNVKDVTAEIANQRILLGIPSESPSKNSIIDVRCLYFISLIRGTIKPTAIPSDFQDSVIADNPIVNENTEENAE